MAESETWRGSVPKELVEQFKGGPVSFEGDRKTDRVIQELSAELKDFVSIPFRFGARTAIKETIGQQPQMHERDPDLVGAK